MLFSTPIFLFGFLPLVLLGYALLAGAEHLAGRATGRSLRHRFGNAWLLLASLFFYWWGEQELVAWMVASIAANYGLGLVIGRARASGDAARGRAGVALGVALNLGLLGWFKYANFFVGSWIDGWAQIALPIGISFYTFQALSYLIDVHRGDAPVQKDPLAFGLYIALFPQLIAGPIVRYHDVATQIASRRVDLALFASGVRRFVIGLSKKVVIADWAARGADDIFALPAGELSAALAWIGLAAYTVQIYFDFSGYSDMAIGIARMFGFRLRENFQWPYVAQSITEFWRRWHISLSSWFRDYLYIPLGGNRGGAARTYRNLALVFLLCGLWHGAAWTFVLWGAYHGLFLVIERIGLGQRVAVLPRPLRHGYTLLAVMLGWLIFRAESLGQLADYSRALVGLGSGADAVWRMGEIVDARVVCALVLGAVGSAPWVEALARWRDAARSAGRARAACWALDAGGLLALTGLWFVAMAFTAADTYKPFIYFRF
ncbi:MBOAT family O-acyltransferase [Engelhardtia mirabilis]|uniref:Peptidoglycan O-acetyltransferase n=1 Tax=Engelhardtia mirabilis TaxID=2528011 RepID=A0A518BR24_9BACT|nr:Peptidoglycan O-acetyltransferase [Planctomycetes bacterium Pla133]QDV03759.1 Peptidoglycan O-acetyltransferase [Planctomycetes bacterium Pla86]